VSYVLYRSHRSTMAHHCPTMDSQSVKTAGAGEEPGYDGNKKIQGRKRHIAVDVLGQLLVLVVHSAGVVDGKGGHRVVIRTPFWR